MYDLNLTSLEFSLVSTSAYLLIYGVVQMPAGLIIDRYGLKKSLFAGAVICSLSAISFAYSNHFYSALFFRLLTGFGSSFGFIGLLVSVYEWMPRRHIALLIGVSQFIGTMGPMIASGPINALAEVSNINWRNMFFFLGIFGFFLSAIILFFVKNSLKEQGNYRMLRRPKQLKSNIKKLFFRFSPWGIALFSAFVYFSVEFLSENDGKIFLHLKGFSYRFSSYMLTISWIGYAIGCPLLGFLSDYFHRRKNMMLISALVAIVAVAFVLFSKEKYSLVIAFFLLGIAGSGQSIGFAAIVEQFKAGYLAIGLSLNNAMITTIAAVNAPIIGFAIDAIKTTRNPTLLDYQIAFYSLIVVSCGALILAIFSLKETFCKSSVDFTYLNIHPK